MDPRNRNQVECNLPKEEIVALKQLIKLQRDRIIIIKPCDKGAGILILDFSEYPKACYEHLFTKLSDTQNFDKKVDDLEEERPKRKIKHVLQEALDKEIITKEEFKAMNPEEKKPAKFYCNFKIHKAHKPMEAPLPRPIISGSWSLTENLGIYVENFIKEISTKHKSYFQDTPHFLRIIEKLNQGKMLPTNAMIVTSDLIGAYQNIPQEDGLSSLHEALEERECKEVP